MICRGRGNGRGQLELGNQLLFVSSRIVGRVGRESLGVFASSTQRESSTHNACLSSIIRILNDWQAGALPTDGRSKRNEGRFYLRSVCHLTATPLLHPRRVPHMGVRR